MFASTMQMLRPAAILRGAVRNVTATISEPIRVMNATSPSTFVRQSQRFTSSASKFYHHTPRSSVFQSIAVNSAFKNNNASVSLSSSSSSPSRTLLAAGATMTFVFGPLIFARSSFGMGSNAFSSRRVAHCAAAAPNLMEKEPLIDTKELTFGMAMGLCSGFLMKKLGKMMMLVIGLGFVSLQLLASNGYVQINWVAIERKFKSRFDVDGDGKVTSKDARHGFRWLISILTTNFQFKSTFVGGFVLGFRYG
ncbi:hypothetical protein BGX26_001492 [Mortierella sp. AD094]|nr:hypothetical protein BGX26_001492 [Mortierella sp. AD094]